MSTDLHPDCVCSGIIPGLEARVAELEAAMQRIEDIYDTNSPPAERAMLMWEQANHFGAEQSAASMSTPQDSSAVQPHVGAPPADARGPATADGPFSSPYEIPVTGTAGTAVTTVACSSEAPHTLCTDVEDVQHTEVTNAWRHVAAYFMGDRVDSMSATEARAIAVKEALAKGTHSEAPRIDQIDDIVAKHWGAKGTGHQQALVRELAALFGARAEAAR